MGISFVAQEADNAAPWSVANCLQGYLSKRQISQVDAEFLDLEDLDERAVEGPID